MGARYFWVTVDLPASEVESASDWLHEEGAVGLELRDGQGGLPGVRAPKAGETIVVATFEGEAPARAAAAGLAGRLPQATVQLEEVPDEDWSLAWRQRIRAVEVGRLWVGPPWDLPKAPADKLSVVVEPKMAFGTGDHPTTKLCLLAVDEFLAQHPGATVLDVGTGTGVLAITALKLGAARAVGTDNDPTAVALAKEAAEANRVEGLELSTRSPAELAGTFDLVVANILANTLVELAASLSPRVGGRLVLAGVLAGQESEVAAAYLAQGLSLVGTRADGEWVRLDLERGA